MSWKIKLTTDVGSILLPLNGSYRTKADAEKDAEKAKDVPGFVKAEVIDYKKK